MGQGGLGPLVRGTEPGLEIWGLLDLLLLPGPQLSHPSGGKAGDSRGGHFTLLAYGNRKWPRESGSSSRPKFSLQEPSSRRECHRGGWLG